MMEHLTTHDPWLLGVTQQLRAVVDVVQDDVTAALAALIRNAQQQCTCVRDEVQSVAGALKDVPGPRRGRDDEAVALCIRLNGLYAQMASALGHVLDDVDALKKAADRLCCRFQCRPGRNADNLFTALAAVCALFRSERREAVGTP